MRQTVIKLPQEIILEKSFHGNLRGNHINACRHAWNEERKALTS